MNNNGVGGSYLIDEKTGEPVLVERTKDAETLQEPAPAKAQKSTKDKE